MIYQGESLVTNHRLVFYSYVGAIHFALLAPTYCGCILSVTGQVVPTATGPLKIAHGFSPERLEEAWNP
jgi:hypothetical protein